MGILYPISPTVLNLYFFAIFRNHDVVNHKSGKTKVLDSSVMKTCEENTYFDCANLDHDISAGFSPFVTFEYSLVVQQSNP